MLVSTIENLKEGDLKDQENNTHKGINKGFDFYPHKQGDFRAKPTFPFSSHPFSLQNFKFFKSHSLACNYCLIIHSAR